MHRAGIDHARDRVVPEILLIRGPRPVDVAVDGILANQVARMPTTDTRCLHPPVGGEVGRAERDALHPR